MRKRFELVNDISCNYDMLTYHPPIGRFNYVSADGINQSDKGGDRGPYKCRESFFWHPPSPARRVAFSAQGLDVEKIAKWWDKLETKLKINKKSQIYRTKYKQTLVIDLVPFWWQNEMRRSFMSLFLRGFHLSKSPHSASIPRALMGYDLVDQIMSAIRLFIGGYTKTKARAGEFILGNGGIADTFKVLNSAELKKSYMRK